MNPFVRPATRAGATAVAVAAGLMVLASTGQSTSGFVPASFGGPLGLFNSSAADSLADVISIGDGPADASELASLLQTAGPITSNTAATFTPGAVPNTAALSLAPTGPASATTHKQSLTRTPVLDSQGRVDCSTAVSCQTDPATHITTVTYPDGVVAIVQQINDMTLVAYKTVGAAIQNTIEAILPMPKASAPLPAAVEAPTPDAVLAAPAPQPIADPTPANVATPEAVSVAAGPVAPSAPAAPDISASTVRPRLTITNPPLDFGADKAGTTNKATNGALGVVKDAFGTVVDAVAGAVGKAITPSTKTGTSDTPSDSGTSAGASRDSGG